MLQSHKFSHYSQEEMKDINLYKLKQPVGVNLQHVILAELLEEALLSEVFPEPPPKRHIVGM